MTLYPLANYSMSGSIYINKLFEFLPLPALWIIKLFLFNCVFFKLCKINLNLNMIWIFKGLNCSIWSLHRIVHVMKRCVHYYMCMFSMLYILSHFTPSFNRLVVINRLCIFLCYLPELEVWEQFVLQKMVMKIKTYHAND